MNEDLSTFIEPELEARIVALVLGEASAFEQEELERVIAERPELKLFKAKLEKLHGLVGEAVKPPEGGDWLLSGHRREKILAKIKEPSPVAEPAPGRRVSKFPRRWVYYGSAACFIAIVGGLSVPLAIRDKKQKESVSTIVSYSVSESDLDTRRDGLIAVSERRQNKAESGKAARAGKSATDLLASIDGTYDDEEQPGGSLVRESRSRDEAGLKAKKFNDTAMAANEVPRGPSHPFEDTEKEADKAVANTRDGGIASNLSAMQKTSEKEVAELPLAEVIDGIAPPASPVVMTGPAPTTLAIKPELNQPFSGASASSDSSLGSDFGDRATAQPLIESPGFRADSAMSGRGESNLIADKKKKRQPALKEFDVDLEPSEEGGETAPLDRMAMREKSEKFSEVEKVELAENLSLEVAGAVNGPKDEQPEAENKSVAQSVYGRGGKGAVGGGLNDDFVAPKERVEIPGIPAEGQSVAGIVTGGLRSGSTAVNRNSVDAILDQTVEDRQVSGPGRWGAERQSGDGKASVALGDHSNLGLPVIPGVSDEKGRGVRADRSNSRFATKSLEEFEEEAPAIDSRLYDEDSISKSVGYDQIDVASSRKLAEKEEPVPSDDPFGGGAGGGASGTGNGLASVDPFMAPADDSSGTELAQQELSRRQSAVTDAEVLLKRGREHYANGNYEEANKAYRNSLEKLPPGTATEERRKVVTDHLKDGSVALSQFYRRTGQYDEARKILTDAEKRSPGDENIKKGLEYLDDPIRTSPALTFEHSKDVEKVRRELDTGEGHYDLGQYDKAEEHFKEVLRTDPYNKAARRWLEKTAAIKSDYYRAAYDNTRAEMSTDGEKKPEAVSEPKDRRMNDARELLNQVGNQLDEFVEMDKDGLANGVVDGEDVDEVRRRLYMGEGLYDLGQYDQAEEEFKQVLKIDPYNKAAREWLSRNAESKEEFGLTVEGQTKAELLAEVDQAWALAVPPMEGEKSKVLERRWVLPEGFTDALAASLADYRNEEVDAFGDPSEGLEINGRMPLEDLLKHSGISFPEGAAARVDPKSNTLVVRNHSENLQLVDQLVEMTGRQKAREERQKAEQLKKIEAFETSVADKSDSTFSLNVSDVSFKLAKSSLAKGQWPEASKVRPEEFVNALSYGDSAPTQAEKVACVIEQGSHPFMQQRNLMRVSMSTAALGRNASTPLRLTVLLDQSGSMERTDRAESVRRAFALLADQLNANDEITLVGFARTPRLLAERVKGNDSGKLAGIVANPLTEGGTNLEAALNSGLQLARQQYLDGAQNRIILLTDGAANLGDALPENLAKQVSRMRDAGIAFDACGVGADGLNDEILTSLTKQGDGRYYFLDRPEDADDGFARQIAGALRPAAKNVKVQVIFNPERVSKFKLYGFEKHKLKKEDFRNDSVDAAEMAAEESGVALYHFEPLPEGRGEIGTVSVRFLDTATNQMVERTWTIPYDPNSASFREANPTLRLAGAAGLFAEKLKGSPVGERVELKRLRQEVQRLKPAFGSQSRFQDLQTMIQQAGE